MHASEYADLPMIVSGFSMLYTTSFAPSVPGISSRPQHNPSAAAAMMAAKQHDRSVVCTSIPVKASPCTHHAAGQQRYCYPTTPDCSPYASRCTFCSHPPVGALVRPPALLPRSRKV